MFFVDRMAAVLKPTDVFLAWLQQYDEDFADLTLAQLRANCSVFLLPVFEMPEEAVAYVGERYRALNWKFTIWCWIWKRRNGKAVP